AGGVAARTPPEWTRPRERPADRSRRLAVTAAPPLEGLRVVELATIVAGPSTGKYLADFGAEVIKVEHPRTGDTTRGMGWTVDGIALWWKLVGRNKKPVTLNLSDERGAEIAKRLMADADVLIENFRPGTLERWNLGPD